MRSKIAACISRCVIACVAVLSSPLALPARAKSRTATSPSASGAQKAFETPQKAADALVQAAANYDVPALLDIFGPGGKDFVSSTDPVRDKNYAQAFAAKAREKTAVTLDPKNRDRAILVLGNDDWPFPVPMEKRGGKWYFDDDSGHQEILFRRIGANELDAIQICRGFAEAQKEYASEIRSCTRICKIAHSTRLSEKQRIRSWLQLSAAPSAANN